MGVVIFSNEICRFLGFPGQSMWNFHSPDWPFTYETSPQKHGAS